jgi:sec-independent protein translocase protein TatA
MFDVGGGELLFILLAIVLLFGPKKLPELARSFGKGMAQLRKAQADFQRNLNSIEEEITSSVEGIKQPFESIANEVVESVQDSPAEATPFASDITSAPSQASVDATIDRNIDASVDAPPQMLTPIPIQPAQGAVPQNNQAGTQSQNTSPSIALRPDAKPHAEPHVEPLTEAMPHEKDALL